VSRDEGSAGHGGGGTPRRRRTRTRPEIEREATRRVRGAELIWAEPERPARGRARGLSREQIVRAAIGLADDEGIGAVSMRRIAQKLHTGAMALYWHVGNKDDLVELMRDAVAGEGDLTEPTGDWRADLATIGSEGRERFLRHPWLAAVIGNPPPLGPNSLRQRELSFAVLAGLGLEPAEMAAITATVDAYVTGIVVGELAEQEAFKRRGMSEEDWQRAVVPYIEQQLATESYPNLARVFEGAPGREHLRSEDVFRLGLEWILDGLGARMSRRAR
jgi:AcrR family transcriptional regulator